MNSRYTLLLLLGCLPWLSACGGPNDVTSKTSSAITEAMDDVSREIDDALATKNISISDDSDGPEAEITPQGDLLIEGRNVAIDPDQRALLLEYRAQVAGIAGAAAAVGMQGADLATKAVGMALKGAFTGNTDDDERNIEAESKKIEALALKLCDQLPAMRATQQTLAARLPEFKPYATMTEQDIDDCHDDSKVELEQSH